MPRPAPRSWIAAFAPLTLVLAALTLALAAHAEPRVVSLSPAVTATLLALDAKETLVGVDEVSARLHPETAELPVVGGLFNPSLEAIVALAPSFVALVPSAQQRGLQQRLAELDVEVLALPNIRYDEVLRSLEVLGERIGRADAARARADAVREAWRAARERADAREPTRTVLVIQRDPLYVVGSGSFLDAMLRAAGAENLAGGFDDPYPRVSDEWLIAAAPELILDADPSADGLEHWRRWPSLPAVASGRIRTLPSQITIPGPFLDRALEGLERAVRGDAP